MRPHEVKVVDAITACRTSVLGGNLYKCPTCGHGLPVYNPCQDRHCPKCNRLKQAEWVEARSLDLLPIPYFHLVFTVPDKLHPLFLANRKLAYGLLFAAASETILEVAQRRLKARVGFHAVLHTWTQTLLFHPHVHCIATGGGLSLDGKSWIACSPNFFLAVRVLSTVYRGKLLQKLERALQKGDLKFDQAQAARCLREAARKRWVVYSKPPFAGPEAFLKYISRYVHRVAIDDRRLVAYDGRSVTFQYRDRRHDDAIRRMTLSASAFLRRFLLHLLPSGFVKIRNYGLLANGAKQKNLKRCRSLLPSAPKPTTDEGASVAPGAEDAASKPDGYRCPHCSIRLVRVEAIDPLPRKPPRPLAKAPP